MIDYLNGNRDSPISQYYRYLLLEGGGGDGALGGAGALGNLPDGRTGRTGAANKDVSTSVHGKCKV